METTLGYDPDVWHQLATELGLVGIAISEEFGGTGGSFLEQVVILEEMGRCLACLPYFSTAVLATHTLLESGDEVAQKRWLPAIAAGETIATLALAEESGRWDEGGIAATAVQDGSGWRLTGTKSYVLDGHLAELILVAARTSDGVSLFAVEGDTATISRTPLQTVDLTRKLARVEFMQTPAVLVGGQGDAWPVLERVLDLAVVAMAAEQVGGAQTVLDDAVAYATDRIQFGRQIGSFQAVKHRCADVLLDVESARSAAYYAAWGVTDGAEDRAEAAAIAKTYCSDAYLKATADNIQIHGGIGFTWEHSAQLYYKRAKSSEILFGQTTYWRELLADRMGL
jgi:alkylation response protein AidB-like acyl-CoA dehydrogenase